jgi:excisionase family DNA binding protein
MQQGAEISGLAPRVGTSVSIDRASEMLNVSRRTIYNLIREGHLQTVRTAGGSQRVLVESLHECRIFYLPRFMRPVAGRA